MRLLILFLFVIQVCYGQHSENVDVKDSGKSIERYKVPVQSSFVIHQDGVGNFNLGDEIGNAKDMRGLRLIPDSNGRIREISVKSPIYSDTFGISVGNRIDSVSLNYSKKKSELKLAKGRTIIGSMGDIVNFGNIIYADRDQDGIIDVIVVKSVAAKEE